MKTSQGTPAYEACREWALHPWLPRPPGVAHIVRGGIITWIHHPPGAPSRASCAPDPAGPVAPPLLTLVAAMIAEVCQ